jgi:hypothetical protein
MKSISIIQSFKPFLGKIMKKRYKYSILILSTTPSHHFNLELPCGFKGSKDVKTKPILFILYFLLKQNTTYSIERAWDNKFNPFLTSLKYLYKKSSKLCMDEYYLHLKSGLRKKYYKRRNNTV